MYVRVLFPFDTSKLRFGLSNSFEDTHLVKVEAGSKSRLTGACHYWVVALTELVPRVVPACKFIRARVCGCLAEIYALLWDRGGTGPARFC